LISGGLILSALSYAAFAILGYTDTYIPYIFLIIWAFNGVFQSTVWPGTVAVLGNWFEKTNRGKIMGLWSSCPSVGNIFGALFGGVILTAGYEWMVVAWSFAVFQACIGVIYVFTVSDKPSENKSLLIDMLHEENLSINDSMKTKKVHKQPMAFITALKLPGVIPFCCTYACSKSLYYGLSMWLPYFLNHRINHKEWVGTLAASLNVGAVIGGFFCGWLGDKLGFRAPIITLFFVFSLPFLLLLEVGNDSIFWMYFIVIPLVGFFVGGASNIVASAVAADLSQNPEIGENTEAMATVTGIIDGAGGLAAAVNTFVMGYLSSVDWLYVFLFMIFIDMLGIASFIHITIKDIRTIKQKRKGNF
jgi:sugar phosphate permease